MHGVLFAVVMMCLVSGIFLVGVYRALLLGIYRCVIAMRMCCLVVMVGCHLMTVAFLSLKWTSHKDNLEHIVFRG